MRGMSHGSNLGQRQSHLLLTTDHGLLTSFEEKINAVKRLAVSTGQLKRLTRLTHPAYRPGSLPGAFAPKVRETSSCGGFHAYMPSAFILAVR